MKKFQILPLLVVLMALLLTSSASAQPPEGTLLTSFNSGVSGVGVGFDGQFLYIPDFGGTTLSIFQTDGTPAGVVPIVGCQATVISWDATRGVFWGASGTQISQITTAGICTPQFDVAAHLTGGCDNGFGCLSLIDGIDYDPGDDSIWYTPDASQRVYHFDTAGNPKPVGAGPNHFFDVNDPPNDMIAECGFNYSSGVGTGVDPNAIYLAANGCDTIFRYDKQTGAKVNSFVIPAQRNEDLECDDVTFAAQNTDAFWIKDLVGPVQAFAVPKGACVSVEVDIEVPVDIKPQSCPNPLNCKGKGVLPVAILGTPDFDVTQIDIELVQLELVGVNPIRVAFEDVATPFEPFTGKQDCFEDCTTEGPDGFLDLTLKFDKQEVLDALGPVDDEACLVLELTGKLKDEFGGTPIVGEDVVRILCKGGGPPGGGKP